MKKSRIVIILVLAVVLSCPVFGNQDSCEGTYEFAIGMADGRMKHFHDEDWVSIGFILPIMSTVVGSAFVWDQWCAEGTKVLYWLLAGVCIPIIAPLPFKPKPMSIPDELSQDQVGCYLTGYGKEARRSNIEGATLGSLFGGGIAFVGLMVVTFVRLCWVPSLRFF